MREFQEHMPYQQGVFIDIFPLDGVPDNKLLRTFKNIEWFCVRKVLWSEVGRIADKKGYMKLPSIEERKVHPVSKLELIV